jgi:hypothetical protein
MSRKFVKPVPTDSIDMNLNYQTLYPKMRMVGADFAAPWRGRPSGSCTPTEKRL